MPLPGIVPLRPLAGIGCRFNQIGRLRGPSLLLLSEGMIHAEQLSRLRIFELEQVVLEQSAGQDPTD